MRTNLLCAIGERITQIRGSRSRPVFARELGVHKNTLVNYEKGDTSVGADFLHQLANQGININWILTGEGTQMLSDPAPTSTDTIIDAEMLEDIVTVLRQHQDSIGRRFSARGEAQLVAEIYQYIIEDEQPTREDRERTLRLIETILGGTNVGTSTAHRED